MQNRTKFLMERARACGP